jgi:hypothetical protein
MKENFDLLGISDQSTIAEIKKAYRIKAKEFHPDVNKLEDAAAKFIAITQAYDKLIDYKEGRTSFNYQTFYEESYEDERGKKAKEYARKRYEEINKQNEWLDKLSIHKIFWGKSISVLLILLCSILILDSKLDAISMRYEIKSVDPIRPNDYSYLIVTTNNRTLITKNHPIQVVTPNEDSIQFNETPIFHLLKSYELKYEDNYCIFIPYNISSNYSFFLYLIIILGMATLTFKFEKIEPKLWIKFLTIIFSLSYLFYLLNSQL